MTPNSRIFMIFPHVENSCEINPSHMVFHDNQYVLNSKVRKRLGWDSETCGEKNPSHMESQTKSIFACDEGRISYNNIQNTFSHT